MSLKDLFAQLHEDREARTRREQHGQGELTLMDGVPLHATGCVLPDGTLTDADCLLPHVAVPAEQHRVWTRRLPGSATQPTPGPASRPTGTSNAPAPPAVTSPAPRASGSIRSDRPTALGTGKWRWKRLRSPPPHRTTTRPASDPLRPASGDRAD